MVDQPTAAVRIPLLGATMQLKYLSLLLLVIQNVGLVMSIKYSRVHPADASTPYIASTAVVMSEVIKFAVSLVGEYLYHTPPGESFVENFKVEFFNVDTIKLSVPGILYCIQNNLLFIAVSNLTVAAYQVSAQIKILTTAVFSVWMLSKQISMLQCVALVLLTAGVAIVQVSSIDTDSESATGGNQIVGMGAILLACSTSGFAGVYFEKMLKTGRKVSLFFRNVQLGFFGWVIGLATVAVNDGQQVYEHGFFQGYGVAVWTAILTQAVGGLLVAVVMKYADNILKGFATSLSIVLGSILSTIFFGVPMTLQFLFGAGLVLIAVYMYGKYPAPPKQVSPPQYSPVSRDDPEAK
mmetsp:Transcript_6881/g.22131  ORF Transcript_6881/g.22131 Transcript_6881/m.22131 type:complete len:352 (-) Transcript_6881:222-1277(-)